MKKFRLFTAAVLLAALAGCASDPNRSVGRRLDDRNVANQISDALDDSPVYKFPHVKVTAYNGVVQLSGFVHHEQQRQAAVELARQAPGAVQVINNISVLSPEAAMGAPRVQPMRTYGSETNVKTNNQYRTSQPDIRK